MVEVISEGRVNLHLDFSATAHTIDRPYPDFTMMKSAELVAEYARRLAGRNVDDMLELGIMRGGSIAYFSEKLKPKRHMAIDHFRHPTGLAALADEIAKEGRRLHTSFDVSQADTKTIVAEFETVFDAPAEFDLVIDDASHAYELSLASFNGLFGRIKPYGLYAIEDWGWSHWEHFQQPSGPNSAEPALSNLVMHCLIACTARTAGIASVDITPDVAFIYRDGNRVPEDLAIERCAPLRGKAWSLY